MSIKIGVICSKEGFELAAIIAAAENGRLPAEIRLVIADRDSSALMIARNAGLYGIFVPRAPFHANRDDYERRLAGLLREAGVETVVLAGFDRELGDVLISAFDGRVYGRGLGPDELVADLEKRLRGDLIKLVERS